MRGCFAGKNRMFLLLIVVSFSNVINAQKLAVKTNVLSDLTLSPNVGIELIVGNHISIDLNATYRGWDFPMDGMQFGVIKPQIRYWHHRPQTRSFFALDLLYMENKIVWNDKRYKGHGFGAGISYG